MAKQFNVIFQDPQEEDLHHQARVLAAKRRISVHEVYIEGLRAVLEIVGEEGIDTSKEAAQ